MWFNGILDFEGHSNIYYLTSNTMFHGKWDLITNFPLWILVVVLEDLAAHFKMKTQDTIDRVTTLIEEGKLTGVIDDRGKFIYISQDELEAVAKFITQRGRVSIAELAENSNRLVSLQT